MTTGVLERQTLPLFRNGEWYTSLDVVPVGQERSGVGGRASAKDGSRMSHWHPAPVADCPEAPDHSTPPRRALRPTPDTRRPPLALSLAPEAVLRHDLRLVRRRLAAPLDPFPLADRRRVMARALDLFAGGCVDVPALGAQSPAAFAQQLLDDVGLPAALVARWSAMLVERGHELLVPDVSIDDRTLHLVSLPSNTFLCLESCISSALAGGALWIRPSAREPFAAMRFVACLLASGWPPARIGFYGVAHASLPMLVREVDATILYGGDELERRFMGAAHVTINGPGRAVAIVDAQTPPEAAAAWLTRLVASDAGRFCTNVGTILCLRDDASAIAALLADALDGIGLDDPDWPLAFALDAESAARMASAVQAALRPGDRVLTRRPMLIEHEGRSLLAPTLVHVADIADHPLAGLEYPFPIAAIAAIEADDVPDCCRTARFVHRSGAE